MTAVSSFVLRNLSDLISFPRNCANCKGAETETRQRLLTISVRVMYLGQSQFHILSSLLRSLHVLCHTCYERHRNPIGVHSISSNSSISGRTGFSDQQISLCTSKSPFQSITVAFPIEDCTTPDPNLETSLLVPVIETEIPSKRRRIDTLRLSLCSQAIQHIHILA